MSLIPEAVIAVGVPTGLFIDQFKLGEGEQEDPFAGIVQEEDPESVPDIKSPTPLFCEQPTAFVPPFEPLQSHVQVVNPLTLLALVPETQV